MVTIKTVTQRLFGRTVIDSLDLNQNAWYIDEDQVTVTAAQINALANIIPVSTPVDVANDEVLFLDHSGGHVGGYDSFADLATAMAGNGLAATAGVFSVDLNELTGALIDVANDSIPFIDATGTVSSKTTVANVATTMAGSGLISAAGTINTSNVGKTALGGVFFTGKGDCTSITVGAATYTVGAGGAGTGEWAVGADAGESATNLTAAINNDTRNTGGTPYFFALKSGAGVIIYGKAPGSAYNAAVARVGGAEPSTAQALVGGVDVIPAKSVIVQRTVTAFDALLAGFDILLPFVPSTFIVQVRDSTGAMKAATDAFAIQATPNRIHVTFGGATPIVATDTVTVYAQE